MNATRAHGVYCDGDGCPASVTGYPTAEQAHYAAWTLGWGRQPLPAGVLDFCPQCWSSPHAGDAHRLSLPEIVAATILFTLAVLLLTGAAFTWAVMPK